MNIIKTVLAIAIAIFLKNTGYAQALSSERVEKIKMITVKITIEGENGSGTGFFVTENGVILTSWHVIKSALVPVQGGAILKKIYAETNGGKRIIYRINQKLMDPVVLEAKARDFCFLEPVDPFQDKIDIFKIESLKVAREGASIYSCGYPLGSKQQFLTTGIISTIYQDSIPDGDAKLFPLIDYALLDIAGTAGCSGAPVIQLGKKLSDDKIVGIWTFSRNPLDTNSYIIMKELKENPESIPPKLLITLKKLVDVAEVTSVGISGCISTEYAQKVLEKSN